jgi:hypothetical protein
MKYTLKKKNDNKNNDNNNNNNNNNSSSGLDDITDTFIRDGKNTWIGGGVVRQYLDRLSKYLEFLTQRIPNSYRPFLFAEVVRLTVVRYFNILFSRYKDDKSLKLSQSGIDQIGNDLNSIYSWIAKREQEIGEKNLFYNEIVIISHLRNFLSITEHNKILTTYSTALSTIGAPYGNHLYDLVRLCMKLRSDIPPKIRRNTLGKIAKYLNDLQKVLVEELDFVVIPKGKYIKRYILDDLFPEIGLKHCTGKKWSVEPLDKVSDELNFEISNLVTDTFIYLKETKNSTAVSKDKKAKETALESAKKSVRIDSATLAAAMAEENAKIQRELAALETTKTIDSSIKEVKIENLSPSKSIVNKRRSVQFLLEDNQTVKPQNVDPFSVDSKVEEPSFECSHEPENIKYDNPQVFNNIELDKSKTYDSNESNTMSIISNVSDSSDSSYSNIVSPSSNVHDQKATGLTSVEVETISGSSEIAESNDFRPPTPPRRTSVLSSTTNNSSTIISPSSDLHDQKATGLTSAEVEGPFDSYATSNPAAARPDGSSKISTNNQWEEKFDAKSQRKYWKNKVTGKSQWADPNATAASSSATSKSAAVLSADNKTSTNNQWEEKFDAKSQRKYWKNKETGKSQWADPNKTPTSCTSDSSATAKTAKLPPGPPPRRTSVLTPTNDSSNKVPSSFNAHDQKATDLTSLEVASISDSFETGKTANIPSGPPPRRNTTFAPTSFSHVESNHNNPPMDNSLSENKASIPPRPSRRASNISSSQVLNHNKAKLSLIDDLERIDLSK